MTYPPPEQLLPHTDSAVLLDEIVRDSEDSIEAAALVTATHPFFVPNHGVPVWVGIEMMAQAVAAHAGLSGQRAGRGPRRGMLLGTRRYQGHAPWFAEGMRLYIRADREFGDNGGLAACECRITCGDDVLAEATIVILEEEAA